MESFRVCVAGINGRMGKEIATAIDQTLSATLSSATTAHQDNDRTVGKIIALEGYDFKPVQADQLKADDFSVLIDFTTVESTIKNLETCKKLKKPIVIGTTGFSEKQLEEIKSYAKELPIVLAPNTSRGVQLCVDILERLTKIIGEEADIEIIEAHHRNKKDAPSGTALKLGQTIANTLNENLEDIATFERHGLYDNGRDKKIGFSVIRAGDIVGEHTTLFSLPGERIEIKHIASSRQTFAKGAVTAAEWVLKQPAGLYSMKDVLHPE